MDHMSSSTLADFLLPHGFSMPHPAAVLREGSAATELGRYALRAARIEPVAALQR